MDGEKVSCTVSSSKITWKILNFSGSSAKKIYSDIFIVGDCKWRLIIFPNGDGEDALSIYLDVADAEDLPKGWKRVATCSFTVINHFDKSATVTKETQNIFNAQTRDWGFKHFISLSKLNDPAKRYLYNDTLTGEAEVHVIKAVHSSKDNEKDVIKLEENKAPEPAVENQTKELAHVPTTCILLLAELSNMRDKQNYITLDSIHAPETANFQQQKEALRIFFSTPLEAIEKADSFVKIEESLQTLVKDTDNLKEKTALEDIISRLANVKTTVYSAKEVTETAEDRRSSLVRETADLDSKLQERQKKLSSLESELSTLTYEEAKLRAEIDKVIAQKKLVSVELERTNDETCKEIEARRSLEAEKKKVVAEWVGAKEKLAIAKVHWDLLREDLGVA